MNGSEPVKHFEFLDERLSVSIGLRRVLRVGFLNGRTACFARTLMHFWVYSCTKMYVQEPRAASCEVPEACVTACLPLTWMAVYAAGSDRHAHAE